MAWAIYFNKTTRDIEVYPLSEVSNYSAKDLDIHFSKNPNVDKWTVVENFPSEQDIDDFENAGGFDSSSEDEID